MHPQLSLHQLVVPIAMGKLRLPEGFTDRDINRVIEMAWEDRTPFDAIEDQFGLREKDVIMLMKREMKLSSWKMWRERVQGRKTKHAKLRNFGEGRHRCSRQGDINGNRISKR